MFDSWTVWVFHDDIKYRMQQLSLASLRILSPSTRGQIEWWKDCPFLAVWRTWRGRNEECWLGSVTTLVAAFVAAIQSFSPTSKQVKLLLLAIQRYLVRSWGRFQVPPLQVMLSGWPIFQLLWRLPGRKTEVTPESRELHRRAHAMSRVIRKCWQGPQGTKRLSCSCKALRPVAKAAPSLGVEDVFFVSLGLRLVWVRLSSRLHMSYIEWIQNLLGLMAGSLRKILLGQGIKDLVSKEFIIGA